MKYAKLTTRHYYKYQYNAWTQPILSANGTLGGSSFAVYDDPTRSSYPAYGAFDSSTSTFWGPTDSTGVTVTLIIYNPNPLKVSSMYYEIQDGNRYPTAWQWYGSDDNSIWTLLDSGTNNSGTFTLSFTGSSAYKYHKFYITASNNGINAKTITLTATEQTITEGTTQDYDFYEDIEECKIQKITTRSYYKYQYSSWIQPVLTENGTVGGDSFAVAGNQYYTGEEIFRAFDNDTSTITSVLKSSGGNVDMYNPNKLGISNIQITNFLGDEWGTRAVLTGEIYACNDNASWQLVKSFSNSVSGSGATWNIDLSDNTNYYNYYRIKGLTTSYSQSGAADQVIYAEINLTAQQRTIISGTAQDYDFYIDTYLYKGVVKQ